MYGNSHRSKYEEYKLPQITILQNHQHETNFENKMRHTEVKMIRI